MPDFSRLLSSLRSALTGLAQGLRKQRPAQAVDPAILFPIPDPPETIPETAEWLPTASEAETPSPCGFPDIVPQSSIYLPDNAGDLCAVTIPEGYAEIAFNAFRGFTQLTSVVIPDSVTEIGACAFEGCSALTALTPPHGVTRIRHDTFRDCRSLTTLTLPDSVTYIEDGAFAHCAALTELRLPASLEWAKASAFSGCGLREAVFSGTGDALLYCPDADAGSEYWIPEGVRRIATGAFSGCTHLKKVHFPRSIEFIANDAFGSIALEDAFFAGDVCRLNMNALRGCTQLRRVVFSDTLTPLQAAIAAMKQRFGAFTRALAPSVPDEAAAV